MTFLENHYLGFMDCPAKSPDMNPIGHIWGQMAIHIRDKDNPPTTQQKLRDVVKAAWDVIRPERLGSLVMSMPRRVRVVQGARGGHAQY